MEIKFRKLTSLHPTRYKQISFDEAMEGYKFYCLEVFKLRQERNLTSVGRKNSPIRLKDFLTWLKTEI